MYAKCPQCRLRFWIADDGIEITPRQQSILKEIPDIAQRDRNGVASTQAIAARIGWSVRTVQYELSHLEHMGEVKRAGQRSGWMLTERATMMVA